MFGINPDTVAANRKRWACLVHKLPDAGLAAIGIDDCLRKDCGFALYSNRHSVLKASAYGVQGPRTGGLTPRPFELAEYPLKKVVSKHFVKLDCGRFLPFACHVLPPYPRLPERAFFAIAHIGAHHGVGGRQYIIAFDPMISHDSIDKANVERRRAINRATP